MKYLIKSLFVFGILSSLSSLIWADRIKDLTSVAGMNRPSLYNAFGDKESMYRETLEHFIAGLRDAIAQQVGAEPDLKKAYSDFIKAHCKSIFLTTRRAGALHLPPHRSSH